MKVFNFTNGRKGEELANVKLAGQLGGWIQVHNGQRYKVELTRKPGGGNWMWRTFADNGFDDLKPETFGVEAICFCIGELKAGQGDAEWEWTVLGTTEWNREACKSGLLKTTHLGAAFTDAA